MNDLKENNCPSLLNVLGFLKFPDIPKHQGLSPVDTQEIISDMQSKLEDMTNNISNYESKFVPSETTDNLNEAPPSYSEAMNEAMSEDTSESKMIPETTSESEITESTSEIPEETSESEMIPETTSESEITESTSESKMLEAPLESEMLEAPLESEMLEAPPSYSETTSELLNKQIPDKQPIPIEHILNELTRPSSESEAPSSEASESEAPSSEASESEASESEASEASESSKS
jgi:hypothetical protein